MSDRVSIIVACRNEEESIRPCLEELLIHVPDAEIVVVDGGTDRTLDIARDMSRSHPQIVAVRNVNDRGKGHAIRTGLEKATGDIMVQFDADLQFSAADIPRVVAPLRNGDLDVCLGSRFLPDSDRSGYDAIPTRDWGNRLISLYVSVLVGHRVTDVTAGLKGWTREAIRRIDFRDDRYSYEAEIVIRAAMLGLRIGEVPVRYRSRAAGQSMHRTTWALARAGLTIMLKSLAFRLGVRP